MSKLVGGIVPRFGFHHRLDDGVYAVQRQMQTMDISKQLPLLVISDCLMVNRIDCIQISNKALMCSEATRVIVLGDNEALFEETAKLYFGTGIEVEFGELASKPRRIGFHGKHF